VYVQNEFSKFALHSGHHLPEALSRVFALEGQDDEVTIRCFLQKGAFMYAGLLSDLIRFWL